MSGRFASTQLTRDLVQEADCFPKDADFYDIIQANITSGDAFRQSFDIQRIHCRLTLILGVLGLLSNSLLLWVVLRHSRKLESVRNLFIVTCIIDLVLATMNIVCVPYVHATMGYFIGMMNVPYPVPNGAVVNILANICGTLTGSSWTCLTMQFIYRFYMIKNGRQMRGPEFRSFIAIAVLVIMLTNVAAYNIYGRPADPRWVQNAQKILKSAGIQIEDHMIVGGKMGDKKVVTHLTILSVVSIVGYGAVVYTEIARRIWLKRSITVEVTRIRTNKANNAFLALAIGPFLTEMLPMSFVNMLVRTCEPIHYSGVIINLVVVTGPIVNAVSAILLVKPYRTAILRYIPYSRLHEPATPTVSATRPQDFSIRTSMVSKTLAQASAVVSNMSMT